MPVTRRQLMAALVTPSLAARPVQAQARRYAALSLLADQFDVVYARESTGSHFDRNRRRSFDAGAGTFDRIALQAVQRALQSAEPGTQLTMLSLPTTSRLYQEPDRIFDGKSVVLPGALVDALDTAKATHLLLLTKVRADALVPLVDGATGFGTVRGLGFYVDANTRFTLRSTGRPPPGCWPRSPTCDCHWWTSRPETSCATSWSGRCDRTSPRASRWWTPGTCSTPIRRSRR
jgi:hypothetical protein